MRAAEPESPAATLWFVHWLRAFAVIAIVFVHVVVGFWAPGPERSRFGHLEPLPASISPPWAGILPFAEIHFFYSTVAVGFFFVASGFLIPLVLAPVSPGRFLVVRWFRIYPVWLLSIALIALVVALGSLGGGPPVGISVAQWLANLAIVTDLTGSGVVLNPVSWTLMIELKFYVLCALAAWTVGLHRAWPIVVLAAVWTAYGAATWKHLTTLPIDHLQLWMVTQAMAWEAKHMPVILIGVCFYNHFRGDWSTAKLVVTSGLLFGCLTLSHLHIDDDWGYAGAKFAGYTTAVVVFALAYAQRERFPASRSVRTVADLCYPIYTLHYLAGILLLDAIVRLTRSPTVALAATLVLIFGLSLLVHRWIERPAIAYGKRVRWPLSGPAERSPEQAPS